MIGSVNEITRFDLQEFGLSAYLIGQITRGLAFSWAQRCKVYSVADVEAAIAKKLSRPRTTARTRTVLENLRLRLRGQSNVVEIDFLPKNPDERIRVLEQELAAAEAEREVVSRQTEQVLAKARRVLQKSRGKQVV